MAIYSPHEVFMRKFVKPKAGRTLIVGSRIYGQREDRRKAYASAVGVDMQAGLGVDIVQNLEDDGAAEALGQFAHIEAWSTLEHSKRPWLLAANLERMLEPGGTIHITVPFVWKIHAYPSDFFRYTPEGLKSLFSAIEWSKVMLAQDKLRDNGRVPVMNKTEEGPKWLARTEVLAVGARR